MFKVGPYTLKHFFPKQAEKDVIMKDSIMHKK